MMGSVRMRSVWRTTSGASVDEAVYKHAKNVYKWCGGEKLLNLLVALTRRSDHMLLNLREVNQDEHYDNESPLLNTDVIDSPLIGDNGQT